MPALGVDDRGQRIGYGQGYYDRLLPACRTRSKSRSPTTSSYCRGPDTALDVAVDCVVTDARTLRVERAPGEGIDGFDKRALPLHCGACSTIPSAASSTRCPRSPGVYVFKDREGGGAVRRQGGEPQEPRPQLLPAEHARPALLHRAPAARDRRSRDLRHRERKRSGAAREQPDQGAPAALQRQAARRQGVPVAATRRERRAGRGWRWCAAPRRTTARYFGPYHSATAARATLRLVNRHFQLRTCTRQRLRSAQAPVPAVPDQALPRAMRVRGRRATSTPSRCAAWGCSSRAATTSSCSTCAVR